MEVLLLALTGFLNIACFVIGAKVGHTIVQNEKVEMPNLNPFMAIREGQARKEAERKQDKLDTILRNIDRYDGTSRGQEDVR
jgi:hypothetical protein